MWQKYARIHDPILAFVWHLAGSDPPEPYALTRGEALTVAGTMGWLTTASWTGSGAYNTNNPGARLRRLLLPYRVDPSRWREKITGVSIEPRSSVREAAGSRPPLLAHVGMKRSFRSLTLSRLAVVGLARLVERRRRHDGDQLGQNLV